MTPLGRIANTRHMLRLGYRCCARWTIGEPPFTYSVRGRAIQSNDPQHEFAKTLDEAKAEIDRRHAANAASTGSSERFVAWIEHMPEGAALWSEVEGERC